MCREERGVYSEGEGRVRGKGGVSREECGTKRGERAAEGVEQEEGAAGAGGGGSSRRRSRLSVVCGAGARWPPWLRRSPPPAPRC